MSYNILLSFYLAAQILSDLTTESSFKETLIPLTYFIFLFCIILHFPHHSSGNSPLLKEPCITFSKKSYLETKI